jgi:hypothetical protein
MSSKLKVSRLDNRQSQTRAKGVCLSYSSVLYSDESELYQLAKVPGDDLALNSGVNANLNGIDRAQLNDTEDSS